MIGWELKGDFRNSKKYLNKLLEALRLDILDSYGRKGVAALSNATPVDSGLTASSWEYKVVRTPRSASIIFTNTNINSGVPIAIILQYGHATGNGGWVEGRDYINPALQPVFDSLADDAWRDITSL